MNFIATQNVKKSPKTIQIFLPDGDPTGIRIAEITTSVIKVVEFPRHRLEAFLQMPESTQVGLYFLIGEDEETSEPLLYIGQSGELKTRMNSHYRSKEFWKKAVVLISSTNNWTQTHATFLEWFSIREAKKVQRYLLENGTEGSKPYTPPPLEADCKEIFTISQSLLETLGYPVFKPFANKETINQEVFSCTRSGERVHAHGIMTDEGFVVFKGSKGVLHVSDTYSEKLHLRERLIKSNVAVLDESHFTFTKNYLFKTPSGASFVLLGITSNGWLEWKNKAGQTLKDVYRSET